MTLAELLPEIKQLSATDKLKLIRILAEKLEKDCSGVEASQEPLAAIWDNAEDDGYAKLLDK